MEYAIRNIYWDIMRGELFSLPLNMQPPNNHNYIHQTMTEGQEEDGKFYWGANGECDDVIGVSRPTADIYRNNMGGYIAVCAGAPAPHNSCIQWTNVCGSFATIFGVTWFVSPHGKVEYFD